MSEVLTPFGQYTRRLRAGRAERLCDMAGHLGISDTYLSSVERGLRNTPRHWVPLLIRAYGLTDSDTIELWDRFRRSLFVNKIDVSDLDPKDRRLFEESVDRFKEGDERLRETYRLFLERGACGDGANQ